MAARGGGPSLKALARDEKPASARGTIVRLMGYLRPHLRVLAVASAWLILSSAATAATPALIGRVIDIAVEEAAGAGDTGVLLIPVAALIGVTLLGWYAQRLQILLIGSVGQEALYALRTDVFGTIQRLPVSFFETSESGDLMSRLINDIETVNSFLSQGFRRLASSTLALLATLVGMFIVDVRLALATLLAVPLMLGTTRLFGLVARRAFRQRQETIGDVSSTLAEELAGIKVAQAFDRTDRNRGLFGARNAANRDANINAAAVSSAFSPALATISASATALVAGYGGWLAVAGLVSVGVVVAFFNYARQFFNAISQLSSLYAETQSALAGGERVFALLDTPSDVRDSDDAISLGRIEGAVDFEDVQFSYATGAEVLRGINLSVKAGETVAIVGATGAGKTTLVNLVPRFYDTTHGTVRIDGHDVRDVTMESLRANLGIVLQDPFLFAGTIADNIRYGRLEANREQVQDAAGAARALEFIERLPEGFDTVVGERGGTLSTGQRQLVALARAILADPAILILDEATSSVDTRTEILIQEALRTLLSGRTALIIAHRLSTVRDADLIVVLNDGQIVEKGTYRELIALDGAFARLHEAQFGE
ncbi:MAG: ABC transporter ATP-binding protein [Coriobacteriia bacterium]|nr:ABC transporter ATP-binding protein [Coriobacteriia bacterium]